MRQNVTKVLDIKTLKNRPIPTQKNMNPISFFITASTNI